MEALSLEIPSGSIYGYLGPNGAGKTTSLRMMTGILRSDSGTLSVLGASDPADVKQQLGYLPEEKGLYKKMRVLDFIVYLGRLKGMTGVAAKKRALALLEQFDLAARARDRCDSLSKGLGQKVQIIATLIHDPQLIVLDEPFSGLDPVNVELIRSTIIELKRQHRTIVFSTHVMEQAEQICDSVLLINQGHKILDGPLSEIRSSTVSNLIIDYEGDGSVLHRLPGVERVNDAGKHAELSLKPGTDTQQLLHSLLPHLTIRRFDTRETSLHEIFIRAITTDEFTTNGNQAQDISSEFS